MQWTDKFAVLLLKVIELPRLDYRIIETDLGQAVGLWKQLERVPIVLAVQIP